MSLKYRLVKRKDFSKQAQEGDMLYYGHVSASDRIKFREICESLSVSSSLSYADVSCVIKAFILVIKNHLLHGNSVQLGDIGKLRMTASSEGCTWMNDFHPSMFKRPRIIYSPGVLLRDVGRNITYDRIPDKYVEIEPCPHLHADD